MSENPDKVSQASRLTAFEFEARRAEIDDLQVVDVRNPGEIELGSIPGATGIPVGQLQLRGDELDPTTPTVVFCAGGYRSSVAASLLRQQGFTDVSDILGGYGAWSELVASAP
jgi:hydroxyacylglutathione hydrolase